VESVAWVSERKDVLSAFFGIATIAAYLRYIRRPGGARLLAVIVCLTLGLMAKPMLVTLPFVLLLLDYWPLGRWGTARVLVEKIPLFLAAGASCAITLVAQQGGAFAAMGDAHYPVRVSNALLAYVRYAAKAVWPENLTIFYPLATPPVWEAGAAAAALAIVSALAVRGARKYPFAVVGWFWYLGTLVPVIGMIQLGSQAMADRYTYLPLTGLCIAASWGLPKMVRARRARGVLALSAVAAIVICAVLARRQVGHWHDSARLFERAAGLASSAFTHQLLGDVRFDQGRLEEAVAEYEEVLRLNPLDYETHADLANLLDDLRQPEQALFHYREALRIHPGYAPTLTDLGLFYERQGLLREAADAYRQALAADPSFAEAHNNLGSVLLKVGQVAEARAAFEEAVRLKPAYPLALGNLGLALERLGERDEAQRRFAEALRQDPGLKIPRELIKP